MRKVTCDHHYSALSVVNLAVEWHHNPFHC